MIYQYTKVIHTAIAYIPCRYLLCLLCAYCWLCMAPYNLTRVSSLISWRQQFRPTSSSYYLWNQPAFSRIHFRHSGKGCRLVPVLGMGQVYVVMKLMVTKCLPLQQFCYPLITSHCFFSLWQQASNSFCTLGKYTAKMNGSY